MPSITSMSNPLIKEIKSLYSKKGRVKNMAFIIEGIKMIEEAILYDYPIKNIIYTDSILKTKDGEEFLEKLKDLDYLYHVPLNIFKEISDTENPQGVLAVVKYEYVDIRSINSQEDSFMLFLDKIQDPGNMGTIIRTADAFQIDGIILGEGCVDPYNPKVVRSTMGSIFRTPLYILKDSLETLVNLKSKGFSILATSLEGKYSYEGDFPIKSICVIGNEANGVDEDILDIADRLIKIPMPGKAESLNAGVAASIIMYEAMKNRNIGL